MIRFDTTVCRFVIAASVLVLLAQSAGTARSAAKESE